MEPGTAVSEPPDPRKQQDSNLAIAIAGVVAVIAIAAILYISGVFNSAIAPGPLGAVL